MERDKNRRGVTQGAEEMRDLMNGWNSVVHLNGLLLPSNNIKAKSESIGSTITLTWDAVEGGVPFCQIEANKRKLSLLDSSFSSKAMNFNNPFLPPLRS